MSTATIPVTVTPEAAARVAELGMQRELDQMLEHAKQTIPGLRSILVEESPHYEAGDEEGVTIWAVMHPPNPGEDRTEWQWGRWVTGAFPPDVFRHFVLMTRYEADHGR
jgi:hypothetical protein